MLSVLDLPPLAGSSGEFDNGDGEAVTPPRWLRVERLGSRCGVSGRS